MLKLYKTFIYYLLQETETINNTFQTLNMRNSPFLEDIKILTHFCAIISDNRQTQFPIYHSMYNFFSFVMGIRKHKSDMTHDTTRSFTQNVRNWTFFSDQTSYTGTAFSGTRHLRMCPPHPHLLSSRIE